MSSIRCGALDWGDDVGARQGAGVGAGREVGSGGVGAGPCCEGPIGTG